VIVRRIFVLFLLAALGGLFTVLLTTYQADSHLNLTGSYYAGEAAGEVGAANIVTAIIVTYRGLDTLGEVIVLFMTATIVGLVLSRGRKAGTYQRQLPRSGELLTTGSRLLVPLILLLGAYVFINGHLTPGGGFQGGAIVASAVLLMLLTDPMRRFSHRLIARVEAVSGLIYIAIGLLGVFYAGGLLDNRILPLGEFGSILSAGAIPLIYIFIGLKVGAEFSSMLVHFSETEGR
jgi:multicomponent Na+:H+ antiporter subunit B